MNLWLPGDGWGGRVARDGSRKRERKENINYILQIYLHRSLSLTIYGEYHESVSDLIH